MKLIINNTPRLHGNALPPASKSQTIRAILIASLAQGKSFIQNPLWSEDIADALRAARSLGVDIVDNKAQIDLTSAGIPFATNAEEINSGNSGITTHFILPFLGLRTNSTKSIILQCAAQMRARPIHPLIDALKNLGLEISYLQDDYMLPIKVSGSLLGGKTALSGFSSQYLSALLLALPCAAQDSEIIVHKLQERPYVEMTCAWLKRQNILFEHESRSDIDIYYIKGQQRYTAISYTCPADFSSAAYLIAAAALIPGEVLIYGLDFAELQGDKILIDILLEMGADLDICTEGLRIFGGKNLTGIDIDVDSCPDLLPILAVIATQTSGKCKLYNAAHTRIKETDRIISIADGLARMGARIETHADALTIYASKLSGAEVDGYGDHRTVMALSVAALLAIGRTTVGDAAAINKSFPSFIALMQSLGADIAVQDANMQ